MGCRARQRWQTEMSDLNEREHARTKHIDLRYHFIREAVEDGKMNLKYVPTNDIVSDIFTKALAKRKFKHFVELLRLRDSGLRPDSGVPSPGVV
jgi:hypothetical protein